MKLLLSLLQGLRLKGIGKLAPAASGIYFLIVAGLKVAGQEGAADTLEKVAPIVGLEAPFPLGLVTAALVTAFGVGRFFWSAIKRAQIERPITDIVKPDPVKGRDYFFELLHVLQRDQGLPLDKAFVRARELLAQAEKAGVSPAAIVAHLRAARV